MKVLSETNKECNVAFHMLIILFIYTSICYMPIWTLIKKKVIQSYLELLTSKEGSQDLVSNGLSKQINKSKSSYTESLFILDICIHVSHLIIFPCNVWTQIPKLLKSKILNMCIVKKKILQCYPPLKRT